MMLDKKIKLGFVNPPWFPKVTPNILTWMCMKTHYNEFGKYKELVDWKNILYRYDEYETIEDMYEDLKDSDIIIFSSYIWNYQINDELAEYVKKKNPKIINLLGGPHIGERNKNLYKDKWMYDYICQVTKPGELFIEDFLNSYFQNNGHPKIEEISYEVRSSKKRPWVFSETSVFRDNYDTFLKLKKYTDDKNFRPYALMETTRGCPYACTFCEWGGGIGTKIVKKSEKTVYEDIDVLSEIGFKNVVVIDANFGVFPERDINILKYAKSKGVNIVDASLVKSTNMKKRKQLVQSLFDLIESQSINSDENLIPVIGIQSISDEAMQVAKRTDLRYNEKLELAKFIKDLCKKYDHRTVLELIRGMPGSTLEDFYQEWNIIYELEAHRGSWRHDYMILPDSESSKELYQNLYDIVTVEVYTENMDEIDPNNYSGIYKNRRSYFKTISSCYSYTIDENIEMFFMNFAGNIFIEKFYDSVKEFIGIVDFCKLCWTISKKLKDFDLIYFEIKDILDPNTPPRDLKKINGIHRLEYFKKFIDNNEFEIYNELFNNIGD